MLPSIIFLWIFCLHFWNNFIPAILVSREVANLIKKTCTHEYGVIRSTVAEMAERAIQDQKVPGSIPAWIQWDALLITNGIDCGNMIISPESEPTLKE